MSFWFPRDCLCSLGVISRRLCLSPPPTCPSFSPPQLSFAGTAESSSVSPGVFPSSSLDADSRRRPPWAIAGDKSNHVPTVHLAQVFYFLAFAGGFFAPHLASVRRTRQALVGSFRSPG